MIKFYNVKKRKDIELTNSSIVSGYRSLVSGATLSIMSPNVNWQEIKSVIGLRETTRNLPMGIVITKPSNKSFFVETVWKDLKDKGQFDGDIILFAAKKQNWFSYIRLTPNEVKKQYPAWHPYHHEDKSYLE